MTRFGPVASVGHTATSLIRHSFSLAYGILKFLSVSSSSPSSSPPRVQSGLRCSQTDVKSREEEWMYLVCFSLPCCCPAPCFSSCILLVALSSSGLWSPVFMKTGDHNARPSHTAANGRDTVLPLRFAFCNAVVVGSIAEKFLVSQPRCRVFQSR